MSCNRLSDWIADAERVSLDFLPEELRRHCRECDTCGRLQMSVGSLRSELRGIHSSAAEMKEVLENVEKMTNETTGALPAPIWRRLLVPAAVLCLGVILAFVFIPGGSQTGPAVPPAPHTAAVPAAPQPATPAQSRPAAEAWASVSGQGGTIGMPDGSKKQITAEVAAVPAGGRVELADASSAIRIAYDSGGTIDVTGKGILQSRADGFETRDASFKAAFRKGKKGFAVRVPGAVLGVRGTTIGFELKDGNGSVNLIEGQVVVQPEHPDMREFEWKVGQRLALAAGKLEKVIPAQDEATPSVEPAKQPQPEKPVAQPKPAPRKDATPAPKSPFENRPDAVQQQPDTMTGDGGDGFGGN